MRFLLTRRWVIFFVVVALLAWLAVELGEWQFRRLDQRRADNAVLKGNLRAAPVPVGEVLGSARAASPRDEWRLITATGRWDADRSVVVRYRTRDSAPGIDVVTPLVTRGGTALLVDRGWMQTENRGDKRPRLPAPRQGTVTVSGYLRVDGTGESTRVEDRSTRAISSRQIGKSVPYPVYGGFAELHSQTPPASPALEPAQLPEIDDGPHFFYGLQWWFFALLAVAGFCYLVYDEWRRRPGRYRTGSPEG